MESAIGMEPRGQSTVLSMFGRILPPSGMSVAATTTLSASMLPRWATQLAA
jgi:hypothetical protein